MPSIHEDVLNAANRIASGRKDWTFSPMEVVRALPYLNENSVRTHVVSRCCVDAPKNHPHKWNYFRRKGRSQYQVLPGYRKSAQPAGSDLPQQPVERHRETIHAVAQREGSLFWAECLELPVFTQAESLDGLLSNLNEALSLHLEGEDLHKLGLADNPRLQLIYEAALQA